ncbi:hypothetical protein Esi_0013_0110 [Ectocarpus siliculosus]|uniref:Uncharacterized protein n=1 Tax=Ectocarpus siliculosus TaxID=2880 RepID=D8LEA6_ECTSI|nr:hypothetical protein Esi_0013_0110 [Ectocarpus siliculosus]|eukprot:CBN74189.1 hypothetical protein Esi_0013_0110 [Ectocarpus siliculosus]
MFSQAKVLLPGYRRAAKELAERQQLELEFAAYKWKMAVGGVAFTVLILILVLSMVILLRWWGKHQADRESALVRTVEESRAETATANEKTTRFEAQRDTARSACYEFQLAVVENRADSHRASAESARVKTQLQTRTKLLKRTEAEKQMARSACYEYQLEGIHNRQDANRASMALAQAEHDLQKMTEVVARFNVQTQECRSSLQSAREQMARDSAQTEAVEEATRKAATQGKETGPQAQQQLVAEGSHASTASELDEEGFGLRHMEEAMLRSMEEVKQDGRCDPRQGNVSSAPWAKATAAPARRRREKKKEPPPTASTNRWAVFAEDEDDDDEDEGKGAEGATPADATPATSPPGRGRTRGKSPSPSRRRANNGRQDS